MDSHKKIKNIFFRINFNEKIGLGHLLRMIIIKKRINNKKKVFFIVDKINSQISKNKLFEGIIFIELYKNKKYINYEDDIKRILKIIAKIDILICDDYRCNANWQKKIKPHVGKLVVINDFFPKKTYADLFINFKHINQKKIYDKLKKNNKNTKFLLGRKYILLNQNLYRSIQKEKKILISFGNSFNFNLIKNFLIYFIKNINKNYKILICISSFGKNYEYLTKISKNCKNISLIKNTLSITEHLNNSSIILGSAGTTIYEAAYLNIPGIFFNISNNQLNDQNDLLEIGKLIYFEKLPNKIEDHEKILKLIELFERKTRINKIFQNKFKIDKIGVIRILKEIRLL
jgi:UDP-2,4-diacetamido-2,4,6-trideoxy-beta-L-altropyranose hydrolase